MSRKLLNKDEIEKILYTLIVSYPDSKCGLSFETPFELLLSLILAAQCTDVRVNVVRPSLTNLYPTPDVMTKLKVNDIYKIVRSCSFPNNKSKHILEAAKVLVKDFNSKVPSTMEKLLTIPGIGRKSANILLNECFDTYVGIAVDTHVRRLSQRIGLSLNTDPSKIEKDLIKNIPKRYWGDVNHILVLHGRNICTSRRPKCSICNICEHCKYKDKNI